MVNDEHARTVLVDDLVIVAHKAFEALAQAVDIGAVVQPQPDNLGHGRVALGPVFEGFRDEVGHRNDQPPAVPRFQENIGEIDLLDVAPAVLEEQRIADRRCLGDGDLQAGHDVAECRAGGESQDQGHHPGRADQSDAGRGKQVDLGQQHTGGQHDGQHDPDPAKRRKIGLERAHLAVLGFLEFGNVLGQGAFKDHVDGLHKDRQRAAKQDHQQQRREKRVDGGRKHEEAPLHRVAGYSTCQHPE